MNGLAPRAMCVKLCMHQFLMIFMFIVIKQRFLSIIAAIKHYVAHNAVATLQEVDICKFTLKKYIFVSYIKKKYICIGDLLLKRLLFKGHTFLCISKFIGILMHRKYILK